MTTFLTAARYILEALYFLSGPLIAIFACIGLRQLTIAKRTAQLNAKREAFRLAADQCSFYFERIIPLLNGVDAEIKKKEIGFFNEAKVTISSDSIQVKTPSNKESLKELFKMAPILVGALNSMESFAVFFTSRLADEKVAYTAVGVTYCSSVTELLAAIVVLSDDGQHFNNLLKLFHLWNARLETEKLVQEKNALEDKIGKTYKKSITPLGTEE